MRKTNQETNQSSATTARILTHVSKFGGISAILVVVVLLASILSFFVAMPGLGLRNWLIILFEMNIGIGNLPQNPLLILNPLDFAVLVLVGITFIGLRPEFGRLSRAGMLLAIVLPFLGIALLIATSLSGRSSVMAAGLVTAFLMIGSTYFSKPLALTGIVANAFLLGADIMSSIFLAPLIAFFVGIGYILLVAWFLLIGARLLGWKRITQDG